MVSKTAEYRRPANSQWVLGKILYCSVCVWGGGRGAQEVIIPRGPRPGPPPPAQEVIIPYAANKYKEKWTLSGGPYAGTHHKLK